MTEQADQTTRGSSYTDIWLHKKETTGYLRNTKTRDYYRFAFHDAEEDGQKEKQSAETEIDSYLWLLRIGLMVKVKVQVKIL